MKLILKNALMLSFLITINSCSSVQPPKPEVVYINRVVVQKQYPDPELTKDGPTPELKGRTIKYKLIREKELEAALKNCYADKAAIRAWAQDSDDRTEKENVD